MLTICNNIGPTLYNDLDEVKRKSDFKESILCAFFSPLSSFPSVKPGITLKPPFMPEYLPLYA